MAAKHRCVLLVEDDISIRETLKDVCEAEGYIVFMASNGAEALRKLEVIPKPCLILCDLMMPVMNGWDFLDRLSADQDFAVVPVVVMSAVSPEGIRRRVKAIRKPFDIEAIIGTIREACGGCPRIAS